MERWWQEDARLLEVLRRIRRRREALGMEQQVMARSLDKDVATYSRIEAGRTILTVPDLLRISETLRETPAYFLEEEDGYDKPITQGQLEKMLKEILHAT